MSSRPRSPARHRPHGRTKGADHPLSDGQPAGRRPLAKGDDLAGDLVPQHRWQGERDLAAQDVEVGVANPARDHPDQDLSSVGPRPGDLLKPERLIRRGEDRRCDRP
jgi:hypothetical protein